MREAVIIAAGRSAIGKAPKGALKDTRPDDVAAQVINGVLDKVPGFDKNDIEDLILGCAFPEAEQGYNVGRIVALLAGLPNTVPGQTVNRFCSSGLQTIAIAANSIIANQHDVVLAGGMETMSMIPMGGNINAPNSDLITKNPSVYVSMGITAENVADKYNISREELDKFSLESHLKATRAQNDGTFDMEVIPVDSVKVVNAGTTEVCTKKVPFSKDEGIRKNIDSAGLAKLKPAFKSGGVVTAGNSSQLSDGVGFVLITSKEYAVSHGFKPIAAFRSFAVTGLDPDYMGLGPITAIPKAVSKANLTIDDIDLFELNEAFASQAIACIKELNLPADKVNVNGGAIAMGHPLGATGSILTVKLLNELKKRNKRYGVVSMCIGGGMGAAGVFEVLY